MTALAVVPEGSAPPDKPTELYRHYAPDGTLLYVGISLAKSCAWLRGVAPGTTAPQRAHGLSPRALCGPHRH
jgi:hypothetical protein